MQGRKARSFETTSGDLRHMIRSSGQTLLHRNKQLNSPNTLPVAFLLVPGAGTFLFRNCSLVGARLLSMKI
jgi:hypothetical protein